MGKSKIRKVLRNVFCLGKSAIPMLMECEHTVYSKCVSDFLQDQDLCSTCELNLSGAAKSLRSLKDDNRSYVDDIFSLETKMILMLLRKEVYHKVLEHETDYIDDVTGNVDKIESLLKMGKEDFDVAEIKGLLLKIESQFKEINKSLLTNFSLEERNVLHMSQYKDGKHFLYDIVVRLRNDENINVCKPIEDLGWRYGKVTCKANRLYIHCLSSSAPEEEGPLVMFQDLKKYIIQDKKMISKFLHVKRQKLMFATLNGPHLTAELWSPFTGEDGASIKGSIVVVADKRTLRTGDNSGNLKLKKKSKRVNTRIRAGSLDKLDKQSESEGANEDLDMSQNKIYVTVAMKEEIRKINEQTSPEIDTDFTHQKEISKQKESKNKSDEIIADDKSETDFDKFPQKKKSTKKNCDMVMINTFDDEDEKDGILLHAFLGSTYMYKISDDVEKNSLLGKLHKSSKIKLNKLVNNEVEAAGISFII